MFWASSWRCCVQLACGLGTAWSVLLAVSATLYWRIWSFMYPSSPSVKHIMTYGILYHCLYESCCSMCIQSERNISLVVVVVVVVVLVFWWWWWWWCKYFKIRAYQAMGCWTKIFFSMLTLIGDCVIRGWISWKTNSYRINWLWIGESTDWKTYNWIKWLIN